MRTFCRDVKEIQHLMPAHLFGFRKHRSIMQGVSNIRESMIHLLRAMFDKHMCWTCRKCDVSI